MIRRNDWNKRIPKCLRRILNSIGEIDRIVPPNDSLRQLSYYAGEPYFPNACLRRLGIVTNQVLSVDHKLHKKTVSKNIEFIIIIIVLRVKDHISKF